MTLRRRPTRASRTIRRLAVSALLLALVCSAPSASGTALAGTRSRTHRTSPTAPPPPSFVETGTAHGAKSRKGSARGNAQATGRPAGLRGGAFRSGSDTRAGKASRERSRRVLVAEQSFPVRHAVHDSSRGERVLAHQHTTPYLSAHGRREYARSFAAQGSGKARWGSQFAAMRASAPPLRWHSPAPYAAASGLAATAAGRGATGAPYRVPRSGDTHYGGEGIASNAPGAAYAEGTAHPEGDESLPMTQVGGTTVAIGPAAVLVAPTSRTQPSPAPPSQARVLSGFGSEVAVAPADPGTTRRRNHPIGAETLPGLTPPPPPATLEERFDITSAAVSPAVLPEIYDRNGRLVMPAPLKGSREVLLHQNTMANNDGLERIQDDGELDRLRANRELVGFPAIDGLHVNDALPYNRRYARPWTVLFAGDIGHDFFNRFHEPIYVTSAVRTVSYQARLQRVNGNAAATDGDAASPHLTGQAIDLAKRGMSSTQLAWMRAYLMPLMDSGKIDVEEEFHQACFHISVYRRYAGGRLPAHEVAQVRPGGAGNAPEPLPTGSAPQDTY